MSGGTASLSGSSDGSYPAAYTTTPMDTDNFYTQMTISGTIGAQNFGASTRQAGPGVRINSSFTQGVFATVDTSGTYIATISSGSATPAIRATAAASSVGDVLKLTAIGQLFTIYKNGTSILMWLDSGLVTSFGAAFRLGGCVVSRANFANSASLTTMTTADIVMYNTSARLSVPMLKSSLW